MANIHAGADRYRFAARDKNLTPQRSHELAVTTPDSAAWSSCASSSLSSTTSRPPPSVGIRITSLRCSRTTSIGPSPVRGFIAAITVPFSVRLRRDASGLHNTTTWGRVVDTARLVSAGLRSVGRVVLQLPSGGLTPDQPGRFYNHASQKQSESR